MKQETAKAIAHGAMGFGIGTLITAIVFDRENRKLRKKNKTSFELHKQLVNDTKADMEDVTISSGELWNRMAQRLNFITASKSI